MPDPSACGHVPTLSIPLPSMGFSLQSRFPLVAMLTFCTIIRKRDHQKFSNFLPVFAMISLIEFSLILLTLLKCLNVQCPSMFTNVCMNYYAHVPCDGNFFYLNHLKIHIYTVTMFYQQTWQCVCSNAVMSDDIIIF